MIFIYMSFYYIILYYRSPECDLAVLELVDCERPSSATPLGPSEGDKWGTNKQQ